jgi:hypothetical protein
MNPSTATLRASDLVPLLGSCHRSLWRWFKAPSYPLHFAATSPKGRTYALPEVVTRLREARHTGLTGAELRRVVAYDTATRAVRGDDFLWIGGDAQTRAKTFLAVLDGEETERARAIMGELRNALSRSGLSGIDRLATSTCIHPAAVRFILTDSADELPIGDGWESFARAIWAVNPIENINELREVA